MHKPTQITAHLILPNRTQAHPPPQQKNISKIIWILDRNIAIFAYNYKKKEIWY
jgi:hypothetical protein